MSKTLEAKTTVVGGALIGSVAVVSAVGATDVVDQGLPLAVVGASLVAVGAILTLAMAALSARQRIVIGAVLAAVGTMVTVASAAINAEATMIVVALTGGALLTAGGTQILQGAIHRAPESIPQS